MPLNPTSYKVICFDWDEVLGVLRERDRNNPLLKELKDSDLSECARRMLDNETSLKSFCLFHTQENTDYYIQAFARREFKKIFNRIYEVNNQYTKPPIAVKIITTGRYEERTIKKVLNQFYTDGKTVFTDNSFSVEYFNRNYWTKGEAFDPNIHNLDKGQLIEDNFPRWQKEMSTLKKTDIYFFDNNIFNVRDVKYHGFPNATIFPTTELPQSMSFDDDVIQEQGKLSYAKNGPEIFQQIHKIIDEYDPKVMPPQTSLEEEEKKPILNYAATSHHVSIKIPTDTPKKILGSIEKDPADNPCVCQIL